MNGDKQRKDHYKKYVMKLIRYIKKVIFNNSDAQMAYGKDITKDYKINIKFELLTIVSVDRILIKYL